MENASTTATRRQSAAPAAPRREESGTLKSFFKAVDILECFSVQKRELSGTEIARMLGMPKSTARRIIDSMREAGFLEQNANRECYRLELRLFEYGSTVLGSMAGPAKRRSDAGWSSAAPS
jgi:biotin operon repressor